MKFICTLWIFAVLLNASNPKIDTLQNECQNKKFLSCSQLADTYEEGKLLPKDIKKSVELNIKACDNGVTRACRSVERLRNMGHIPPLKVVFPDDREFDKNDLMTRNILPVVTDYAKECDNGNLNSCYEMADKKKIYFPNVSEDVSNNLFKTSCEAGNAPSCQRYGEFQLSKANLKNAVFYFEKACQDGEISACIAQGHTSYQLNKKNDARTIFEKVCKTQGGYEEGCLMVSFIDMENPKSYKNGIERLKTFESFANEPVSATYLANLYMQGKGLPKNQAKAKELYLKACSSDVNSLERDRLHTSYSKFNPFTFDKEIGEKSFEQLCQSGNGSCCYSLGLVYLKGKVLPQNIQKAKQLFKKGCDLGDNDGCRTLKVLH